jgi:hypothetical protein
MVVEKSGKINKDYILLNPPLGKGKFFILVKKYILIKGAFGEVRKGIHR